MRPFRRRIYSGQLDEEGAGQLSVAQLEGYAVSILGASDYRAIIMARIDLRQIALPMASSVVARGRKILAAFDEYRRREAALPLNRSQRRARLQRAEASLHKKRGS